MTSERNTGSARATAADFSRSALEQAQETGVLLIARGDLANWGTFDP